MADAMLYAGATYRQLSGQMNSWQLPTRHARPPQPLRVLLVERAKDTYTVELCN